MILGYEQPVDIPVMSIYDKDMLKSYISVLQKEYDRNLLDLKDFITNFGNFISPIVSDMLAWNDRTLQPMQDMLAAAQAQGVDLLRSQEGRMMLANLRNSIPYGDLAKLRQSAENAKKYLAMAAEMKAKGLYNDDFEKFLGVGDVNTWNTLQDGMWNTLSPTEFKDLNKLTSHWFDDLKDSYLYTKDGYDYTGVTDAQMKPVVDSFINGLLGSDLGRYYLQKAGNINNLINEILTANKERKHENRDTNAYDMENVKFKHDMAGKAYDRATQYGLKAAEHQYNMAEIYAKNGGSESSTTKPGDNIGHGVYYDALGKTLGIGGAAAYKSNDGQGMILALQKRQDNIWNSSTSKNYVANVTHRSAVPVNLNPTQFGKMFGLTTRSGSGNEGYYAVDAKTRSNLYTPIEVASYQRHGNNIDKDHKFSYSKNKKDGDYARQLNEKKAVSDIQYTGNMLTYYSVDNTVKVLAEVKGQDGRLYYLSGGLKSMKNLPQVGSQSTHHRDISDNATEHRMTDATKVVLGNPDVGSVYFPTLDYSMFPQ